MIVKAQEGPYLRLVDEDGATTFIACSDVFETIWNDFVSGKIPNSYCRGILIDLGFTPHQVFHAMEQLQLGKTEYEAGDYLELSYV